MCKHALKHVYEHVIVCEHLQFKFCYYEVASPELPSLKKEEEMRAITDASTKNSKTFILQILHDEIFWSAWLKLLRLLARIAMLSSA